MPTETVCSLDVLLKELMTQGGDRVLLVAALCDLPKPKALVIITCVFTAILWKRNKTTINTNYGVQTAKGGGKDVDYSFFHSKLQFR